MPVPFSFTIPSLSQFGRRAWLLFVVLDVGLADDDFDFHGFDIDFEWVVFEADAACVLAGLEFAIRYSVCQFDGLPDRLSDGNRGPQRGLARRRRKRLPVELLL